MKRALLLLLCACHSAPSPPPADVPQRLATPKARAVDAYIKGYNLLVVATAHHLIDAHNTSVTVAEMGKLMPHFGVQQELMKEPLRDARAAFDEAKKTDPSLAEAAQQADALVAGAEALTESFRHLSDYYDRAGFQVDNGAQADSLAKDFATKENTYRDARLALEKTIGKFDDDLALEELKQFEAAHSFGYWLRKADIDAKMLWRAAQARDAAAFKPARATFENTILQMQAFSTQHREGPRTFDKLIKALSDMNVVAIRLQAVLGKKKTLADNEARNLDHAYSNASRYLSQLYDMETNGGGLD